MVQSLAAQHTPVTVPQPNSAVNDHRSQSVTMTAVTSGKKNTCGAAQAAFIRRTLEKVTTDLSFFEKTGWVLITVSDGNVRSTCLNRSDRAPDVSVEHFHVKEVAAWMPHGIVIHAELPPLFK